MINRCAADTYAPFSASLSCTSCPTGSSTKTLTGQTTCSCVAGGSTTTAGGFYGNGLTDIQLGCTGTGTDLDSATHGHTADPNANAVRLVC